MTDDAIDEPTADELAAVGELLARADVWDELPPGLEDDVVAAISAEAAAGGEAPAPAAPPVVSLDEARARRRAPGWLLGAAAAAVMLVIGAAVVLNGSDDGPADEGGVVMALAPSEAAGSASASAVVTATPAGLKIVLDVDDLPGAPEGSFYEAWLSDGETIVSAGTFHLRDGDNPIALWAGIADPSFNLLGITLEPLDGNTDSSGDLRFTGEFDADAVFGA